MTHHELLLLSSFSNQPHESQACCAQTYLEVLNVCVPVDAVCDAHGTDILVRKRRILVNVAVGSGEDLRLGRARGRAPSDGLREV